MHYDKVLVFLEEASELSHYKLLFKEKSDEPMSHQITSSIISEKKCKRFMTASITSYNNLFIGAAMRQEEEHQENKAYTLLVGTYENLSANMMELW